jgi:hypothetical protein
VQKLCTLLCGKIFMLTKGYKMWWNYFEIAYGKEEWNEAGPVVKRALSAKQIQNPLRLLGNAGQVVTSFK